ncbi:MAG: hypothetical protein ABJ050_16035 [Paracoccaceae bacterium]
MKSILSALCSAIVLTASSAVAQEKPDILVIWGDDIGFWNPSFVNNGMMG